MTWRFQKSRCLQRLNMIWQEWPMVTVTMRDFKNLWMRVTVTKRETGKYFEGYGNHEKIQTLMSVLQEREARRLQRFNMFWQEWGYGNHGEFMQLLCRPRPFLSFASLMSAEYCRSSSRSPSPSRYRNPKTSSAPRLHLSQAQLACRGTQVVQAAMCSSCRDATRQQRAEILEDGRSLLRLVQCASCASLTMRLRFPPDDEQRKRSKPLWAFRWPLLFSFFKVF